MSKKCIECDGFAICPKEPYADDDICENFSQDNYINKLKQKEQ